MGADDEESSEVERPGGNLGDDPDPFEDEEVGETTDIVDEDDALDALRIRLPLVTLLAK